MEEKEDLPLERQPLLKRLRFRTRDYITYTLYVVVAVYVVYSLVASIYTNYQSQKQIKAAKANIAQLTLEKEKVNSLLTYYNTKSYQEIELRRRLLLKKPGEIVVALNGNDPLTKIFTPEEETIQKTPWQEWYDYYFKPQ